MTYTDGADHRCNGQRNNVFREFGIENEARVKFCCTLRFLSLEAGTAVLVAGKTDSTLYSAVVALRRISQSGLFQFWISYQKCISQKSKDAVRSLAATAEI